MADVLGTFEQAILLALVRLVKDAYGRLVSFQNRDIGPDVIVAMGRYAFNRPRPRPASGRW